MALSTPFEGLPILQNSIEVLSTLINPLKLLEPLIEPNFIWLLQEFIKNKNQQGIKDLEPSSSFLSKLKDSLCKETVPILAIAAEMPKFAMGMEIFNNIFEQIRPLIVGDSKSINNGHDMIVPVTSQFGASVLPKASRDLQRDPILAFHFLPPNASSLLNNFMGAAPKDILHSDEMADQVVGFAKYVLNNN